MGDSGGGTSDGGDISENEKSLSAEEQAMEKLRLEKEWLANQASRLENEKKKFEEDLVKRISFIDKQLSNVYSANSSAPFSVTLERVDSAMFRDNKTISEIALGRSCCKQLDVLMKDSYNLSRQGNFKFSISFYNYTNANEFVKKVRNKDFVLFDKQSWSAYIPDFIIYFYKVLGGIGDVSITEDEIMKIILPYPRDANWTKPVLIEPMYRFVNDNFVKSGLFKFKFNTDVIPDKVSIYGKILYLNPFVHKTQRCFKCRRYGHSAKFCKQRGDPICAKCALQGHSEFECTNDFIKCINCTRYNFDHEVHRASSLECLSFLWNKSVKFIMAKINKPYLFCESLLKKGDGVPARALELHNLSLRTDFDNFINFSETPARIDRTPLIHSSSRGRSERTRRSGKRGRFERDAFDKTFVYREESSLSRGANGKRNLARRLDFAQD